MITIAKNGRLGNAMFRNCAASILSKKFNIKVEAYLKCQDLKILRPMFHAEGERTHKEQIQVKYNNFFSILGQNDINYGLDLICPCQSKNFVLNYQKQILNQFDLQYDEYHKNDLFIHVRAGDCIKLNRVASIDYYTKAIEQSQFNIGYISSDTPSHETVTHLINKFNLTPYFNKPAETINFAKDFGSLVLSNGTFSWWMAFLSKAKNIFYPIGGPKWCGDIFVFDEWKPIQY
jgi:hypothetical protein